MHKTLLTYVAVESQELSSLIIAITVIVIIATSISLSPSPSPSPSFSLLSLPLNKNKTSFRFLSLIHCRLLIDCLCLGLIMSHRVAAHYSFINDPERSANQTRVNHSCQNTWPQVLVLDTSPSPSPETGSCSDENVPSPVCNLIPIFNHSGNLLLTCDSSAVRVSERVSTSLRCVVACVS